MSILSTIKRGSSDLPHRILVAGPEGIGKSTFGAKAPNPLFIAAEDGLTGLEHVARTTPESLDQLHQLLDSLIEDAAGYKNVVIDTTDWLERFLAAEVCKRDSKENIEEYGYGKGYVVLENELVRILQKLDELRNRQKVGVILLAHVHIKAFSDPRGETWDRYEMKGHKRFTGILREWPDANLFATYEVFKTKGKNDKKEKTIGGARVLHTQWSPAWDAKNRLNLPEELPLEWDALAGAIKENSSASLISKLKALHSTAKLEATDKEKWDRALSSIETLPADKLKSAIEKLSNLQ